MITVIRSDERGRGEIITYAERKRNDIRRGCEAKENAVFVRILTIGFSRSVFYVSRRAIYQNFFCLIDFRKSCLKTRDNVSNRDDVAIITTRCNKILDLEKSIVTADKTFNNNRLRIKYVQQKSKNAVGRKNTS